MDEELVERVAEKIAALLRAVANGKLRPPPDITEDDERACRWLSSEIARAAIAECKKNFGDREIELLRKLEAVVCGRAKLEAEAAAMREALEFLVTPFLDEGETDDFGDRLDNSHNMVRHLGIARKLARAALSPDAGKAMLRVVEALRLTLPMAKGYAAAHRVGSNAEYMTEAEEALAALDGRKE